MIKAEGKFAYKPNKEVNTAVVLDVVDFKFFGSDAEVFAWDKCACRPYHFYYSANEDIWLVPDPDGEDADCYIEFQGEVLLFEYKQSWTKGKNSHEK